MIEIRIGNSNRSYETYDENWVNEQINRRRAVNEPVCVQVVLDKENIHIGLSSPVCSRAGGNGRPLNEAEQAIVELWEKHHLNTPDFSGGSLVAFLKQLRQLV